MTTGNHPRVVSHGPLRTFSKLDGRTPPRDTFEAIDPDDWHASMEGHAARAGAWFIATEDVA